MDVPTTSINVLMSPQLELRLKKIARQSQKNEQELIIEAIESYLLQWTQEKTCYDLASELGVIGSVPDLPSDLSTNSDYFKDFGM